MEQLFLKFLVLAAELSYIEQAERTYDLLSGILDLYRYCSGKKRLVSLYYELEKAKEMLALLRAYRNVFPNIQVTNSETYRTVEVFNGSSIEFLSHLLKLEKDTVQGTLIYEDGLYTIQKKGA